MSIPNAFRPVCGAAAGELPPGYRPLEYLEGTGSQWIDTGFLATGGLSFKVTTMMFGDSPALQGLIGSHNGLNYARLGVPRGYGDTYVFWRVEVYNNLSKIKFGQWQTIEYMAKEYYGHAIIDGVQEITQTNALSIVPASNATVCLFKINKGSVRCAVGRIKDVTIWDKDDIVVRRMVPALDVQGVPCMFDLVTRQPFYNSGTGQFLYN